MRILTKLGAVVVASSALAGCTVTVPEAVAVPSMQLVVDGARAAMQERSTASFWMSAVHDDYKFRGYGDLRRDSFRPDAEMTIGPGGYDDHVIYVGGALYDVTNTPTLLIPPDAEGDIGAFRDMVVDLIHTADPGRLLDLLEATGVIVGWEGEDDLRGDKAQHYAVELDLDALCAYIRSGAEVGLVFRELVDGPSGGTRPISTMTANQDGCAKSGTAPADIWVDERQQVRRFELPDEVTWQDDSGAERKAKRLELLHRDWGLAVGIRAPEKFYVAE